MKLQKQKTREVKGKEYHRWVIVVPPSEVEKLGWQEGQRLKPTPQGKKLIIEPERDQA